MIEIISKASIKAKAEKERPMPTSLADMAHIVTPGVSPDASSDANFAAMAAAKSVARNTGLPGAKIREYGSAWDIPRANYRGKTAMSVREKINSGIYMSGNSVIQDWEQLWDALRMDISIRKTALSTVRENFYNVVNMPNSDKTFKVTEFFPHATIFEEHNGMGQSVSQGETRAGQTETLEHILYAAGWTWDLLAEMFRNNVDPEKISESVTIGYNSKRDDLSITPILNFSYAAEAQTPAATLTGADREQLLHRTLENAIDEMGQRKDPITDREIDVSDLRVLASPFDARHIQRVVNGLPSPQLNGTLPAISEISRIVAYDGETVRGRVKDTVYPGVTSGKAYLLAPNRYMNIAIKRGLTLEVDMTPDVTTLAREKRSWYFAETQQTTGLQWFVQEVTLPAWPLT